MAEEGATGTQTTEGQTASGPDTTTAAAPAGDTGKPAGDTATGKTAKGTQEPSEESFFDPASIKGKPELEAAYKNMQRAFGKKMEAIKADRKKIDAYDSFTKDPVSAMQNMASRYGFKLTRAEAAQAVQDQTTTEPQTWDDVYKTAEQRAYDRVIQKLSPIISEVQSLRKSNLEKLLDDSCPDWRQYEDEMSATLKQHPTLVSDPAKLYRMSVPPEVLESRAMQQALKKLESKAKGTVAGASTTKSKSLGDIPDKPLSFNEAVEFAKNKLREQGITAPR